MLDPVAVMLVVLLRLYALSSCFALVLGRRPSALIDELPKLIPRMNSDKKVEATTILIYYYLFTFSFRGEAQLASNHALGSGRC